MSFLLWTRKSGFALAALLFALLALESIPAAAETLTIVIPDAPRTIDPHLGADTRSWTLIYPCYDRLVGFKNRTTQVEPSLALTWRVSDNGLLYTFVLNKGRTFDGGGEVDARAVAFSFRRLIELKSAAAVYFPELAAIETLGPYTVRFVLDRPSPSFLAALASGTGSIVSPGIVDRPPGFLDKNTLGSGPYRLASWSPTGWIVLEARPDLPVPPKAGRFEVLVEKDADLRKEHLCSGRAHLAEEIDYVSAEAFEFEPAVRFVTAPTLQCRYLALNCGRPWMRHLEARQVTASALDYGKIIRLAPGRAAERMPGPLPSGVWGRKTDIRPPSYDPDSAAFLLDEAGRPQGPLVLAFNPGRPGMGRQAARISKDLGALNLAVTLAEYRGDRPSGRDYDMALLDFDPAVADAGSFFRNWIGPDNPAGYHSPEAETNLEQASFTTDKKRLQALYGRLADKLMKDSPYVFLYQKEIKVGVSRRLGPFEPHPMLPRVYDPTRLEPTP